MMGDVNMATISPAKVGGGAANGFMCGGLGG